MLHQKFKQEIWLPVQHPGVASPVPLWRSRQIYEHFFNHTMDPHVHVLRRMRRYRMIGNALSHVYGGGKTKKNRKQNIQY